MNSVIKTENVGKHYGRSQVLKGVNLNIQRGQIVGLIGLNGAGKTTLLRALLGLSSYEGKVDVLGLDPCKKRTQLMQKMCFIADVAILPRWLKVCNAIDFVEGVHPLFNREKALDFLSKTNIPLNNKIKTLSKGMIVQLHLALIMAIDADILILDEPTLGLDILYRKSFYENLLSDYFTEHRTIVVTTHQVEEIEHILTNIIMINRGEITLDCAMDEFADRFIELSVSPEQADKLSSLNPIASYQQFGQVRYLFENQDAEKLKVFGELTTPSVSDVFVAKVAGERK